MRPAITDIPLGQYARLVKELGFKSYAADQLAIWLYKKRASSFDEMTDLSKAAREKFSELYEISAVREDGRQQAADGTIKLLCRGLDDAAFECVLIPAEDGRKTICISTQVGCQMACGFCRTATMGFVRNLTVGEIVGQLILIERASGASITNIVLMGMGEPLLNQEAVEDAIEIFCDERAFGLSRRRITLSTSGLIPELESFCRKLDIKIAISLNATDDETRSRLMPVNKLHPISEIMEFARRYTADSRYMITFEYVLIKGVNDTRDDAKRLVGMLKGIRAKVNLIPYNPYKGSDLAAPDEETVAWWSQYLHDNEIQINIRASRGQEILAACGQLASESK